VCAIDRGAVAWCWGDGFGSTPVRQPWSGVVDIAVMPSHGCVISDRGLECWGSDRNGEAGDIDFARRCTNDSPCTVGPTPIPLDATKLAIGERHACALVSDGRVACWGSNELGQLGRDDAFLVGGVGTALDGAVDLGASYAITCARRADRTAWCWGAYAGAY
jgi:alpha-tubulin suppressor-like RCC1 family protein